MMVLGFIVPAPAPPARHLRSQNPSQPGPAGLAAAEAKPWQEKWGRYSSARDDLRCAGDARV